MGKESLLNEIKRLKDANDKFVYAEGANDKSIVYEYFKELEKEGKIKLNAIRLIENFTLQAEGKYIHD